jgi:hypothetical protein
VPQPTTLPRVLSHIRGITEHTGNSYKEQKLIPYEGLKDITLKTTLKYVPMRDNLGYVLSKTEYKIIGINRGNN